MIRWPSWFRCVSVFMDQRCGRHWAHRGDHRSRNGLGWKPRVLFDDGLAEVVKP